MGHCRIGRIKFKKGGEIIVLPPPTKNFCSDSLHSFASSVGSKKILCIGAFAVLDDGDTITHITSDAVFPMSNVLLVGGCSTLLLDINLYLQKSRTKL